jgi:hypothetical protein
MKKLQPYEVTVESSFAEHWRYNFAITCSLCDAEGGQESFVSATDEAAPVGSALTAAPEGMPSRRRLTLRAGDCHHLRMFVYLIPNTLPASNRIADNAPFPLTIKVTYNGAVLLHEKRMINQWSGMSSELVVCRPE